jgi:hypothetical protein
MTTNLCVFVSSVQKELTSRRCQEFYKLSPQAVYEDFQKLIEFGIARKIGSGRSTRYGYNPHD